MICKSPMVYLLDDYDEKVSMSPCNRFLMMAYFIIILLYLYCIRLFALLFM